jgi:hypothetical protein
MKDAGGLEQVEGCRGLVDVGEDRPRHQQAHAPVGHREGEEVRRTARIQSLVEDILMMELEAGCVGGEVGAAPLDLPPVQVKPHVAPGAGSLLDELAREPAAATSEIEDRVEGFRSQPEQRSAFRIVIGAILGIAHQLPQGKRGERERRAEDRLRQTL